MRLKLQKVEKTPKQCQLKDLGPGATFIFGNLEDMVFMLTDREMPVGEKQAISLQDGNLTTFKTVDPVISVDGTLSWSYTRYE